MLDPDVLLPCHRLRLLLPRAVLPLVGDGREPCPVHGHGVRWGLWITYEEPIGAGEILGLSQPEVLADEDAQRIPDLRGKQTFCREIGVGGRRAAEADEWIGKWGLAVMAVHAFNSPNC